MKKVFSILLLQLIAVSINAQDDFNVNLDKAIKGVENNFASYKKYEFITSSGHFAYLADFTFTTDPKSYVYSGFTDKKLEIYFFQTLTYDLSKYQSYYDLIEKNIIKRKEKWTKLNGAGNKSVAFTCEETGAKIFLMSTDKLIAIKILRDELKSYKVFSDNLCEQLVKITDECGKGFKGIMGKYQDSSVIGKAYESNLVLNNRARVKPTIRIKNDIFEEGRLIYSFYTTVYKWDLKYEDIVIKFEQCLTFSNGWKKQLAPSHLGEGIQFEKNKIIVRLLNTKNYNQTSINIENN